MPTLGSMNENELILFITAIAVSGGIAVISVVFGAIRRVLTSRQREISRREIAAYVAEGSMTPDEGERLLNAGKKNERGCL